MLWFGFSHRLLGTKVKAWSTEEYESICEDTQTREVYGPVEAGTDLEAWKQIRSIKDRFHNTQAYGNSLRGKRITLIENGVEIPLPNRKDNTWQNEQAKSK